MKKINSNNLYYWIQFTWGLPLNLVGILVYYFLVKILKCKTYKHRKMICIVVPINFGGLNLGAFAIHGEKDYDVATHEYGHSIQNLMWGWLMPFVITIPSAARYWQRELSKVPPKTGYYDIWFEKQATDLGLLVEQNRWSFI